MLDSWRLFGFLFLLVFVGCGEDDSARNAPLPEAHGAGIVVDANGVLEAAEGLPEAQGKLVIDATLAGAAVTDKLAIKLSPVGVPDTDSGSGPGGQEYTLAAGEYTAALVYTQDESIGSFEGSLNGLEVRAGQVTRYKAQLTVPIGFLVVRFLLEDRAGQRADISADVKVAVYKAKDDATLVKPTWEGKAGAELLLPKGKYKLRATYAPARGRAEISEWHKGIEVGATLTRTEKEIVIKPAPLGVRVDAYNYSRDINAGTNVFFFAEGADMSRAIARAKGSGGTVVEVPSQVSPGKYDLLLLYQPSPMTNPDLKIEKVIKGFEIPETPQAIRVPVDLETPLGIIQVQVTDGEADASDRIEMRVMRGGADPNAATPALEEFGVSEHFVPSGVYDIYFKWKKDDAISTVSEAEFIGVELGNGYRWDQTFERGATRWEAVPVRMPLEALHPITWSPPSDDDDSAGDDDDSAGS